MRLFLELNGSHRSPGSGPERESAGEGVKTPKHQGGPGFSPGGRLSRSRPRAGPLRPCSPPYPQHLQLRLPGTEQMPSECVTFLNIKPASCMEKVICELVLIQGYGQVLETMARPQPICGEDLVRGGL
ncbi:hypothetical protein MDA_GLEAN10022649 [Myotis davidii]|uniref:Uncharacterized protein n=1 Tax=Myotis davidii TaxID=225400 RepID=L5LZA4_MYODS|nr:hypothetical protein MDA_GLEAN10022649 [Myotis davidii]